MGENSEKRVVLDRSFTSVISHALSQATDASPIVERDPKTGHLKVEDLPLAVKGKIIDYIYMQNYKDSNEISKYFLKQYEKPQPLSMIRSEKAIKERLEENERIKHLNRIMLVSGLGEAHNRRKAIGYFQNSGFGRLEWKLKEAD